MGDRATVIEAAYDDYCRRAEASQQIDVDEFVEQYPSIRSSLRRQIQVHQFLEGSPEILNLCKAIDWPAPGSNVFDFTIIEEIGRGAFARVYLCAQSGLGGREVVVKFAMEGAFEADMLGRLSHPSIMPVHSVEYDEFTGTSAICMPYRGRATICDLIDEAFSSGRCPTRADVILRVARHAAKAGGCFSENEPPDTFLQRCSYAEGVVHLGVQVAEALQHAHDRGILHGDLKPSNILLTPRGRPLLLDFNLARGNSSDNVAPGGTLPYMPPEHLELVGWPDPADGSDRVDAAGSDGRSDIFSLGVILYELLAGRLPFRQAAAFRAMDEPARYLLDSQRAGPTPLQKVNPAIDRPLAVLIERCLSFDPALRPATAGALAKDLRHCLSPWVRGRRWVFAHIAFTLLCLAVILFGSSAMVVHLLSRPPYHVRMYQQAISEYNDSRPSEAITDLNQALAGAPQFRDALLLRACAYVRSKNFKLAFVDFQKADIARSDDRCAAAQAYCLCRLTYFKEACALYQRAIAEGYKEVDAYNNLAYCDILVGVNSAARPLLDEAARRDIANLQILFNRAQTELQLAHQNHEYVPTQGMADCEQALRLSGPNANLELLAARLSAIVARKDVTRRDVSLKHFERACGLGLTESAATLSAIPDLVEMRGSPRFRLALSKLSKSTGSTHPDHLIEPSLFRRIWTGSL